MDHDPNDIDHYLIGNEEQNFDPNPGCVVNNEFGMLSNRAVTQAEKNRATALRDQIAQDMWDHYQSLEGARGEGWGTVIKRG